MSKKKNDISKENPSYEANRKIRRDWNGVKPYTRIIESKKKNPKIKHKGRQYDED